MTRVLGHGFSGTTIYVVHAMKKKTQALPQEDIDVILRRLKEV